MKHIKDMILEAARKIRLPHTFDIYNSGPKNVSHKITKHNIYKIFFSIEDSAVEFVDKYAQMIKLPLAPDAIAYKEYPTKANTNNWTEVPEIVTHMYAGAWYSDKWVEYNYDNYNRDWDRWLNSLKPYMSGKVSVTLSDSNEKDGFGWKQLIINVNNDKFNKEREEKIKRLQDPANLQYYAEAERKRAEEIERENAERIRKQKEFDDWWNSLSDGEKLSWEMGYGQGRYMGD